MFWFISLVFLSTSTVSVFAISENDYGSLHAPFHDECSLDGSENEVAGGSGEADGTTFPDLDPAAMADAINRFIEGEKPNSRLSGLGETIVAGAENSNISPFLIVAHAHAESDLADPNDYNVRNGNNSFGRAATSSQPNFSGARLWYKWSSVKASVDHTANENQGASGGGDIAAYIRVQYPDLIDRGDLDAYLLEYVADGSESQYGQMVRGDVRQMVNMTGGSSGGGDTQAQQESDFCACGEEGGISASGSISSGVGQGMSDSAKQKFQEILVAAGEKFDVDPNFIAAFYYAENARTGDSTNNASSASPPPVTGDGNWREPAPPYGNGEPYGTNEYSTAGAFQFIPSTWDAYGADGNNDGRKDPQDLADGAFGAANYLAALGGKKDANEQKLRDAAFGYNHSDTYVDSIINTYDYLSGGASSTVSSSGGCPGSGGSSASCEQPSGTPKDVIDNVAIPIAKDLGFDITPESNDAANGEHNYHTESGNVSDHSGPPERAWAADISNGTNPTPEMDKLAEELASCFDIPWEGSGAISHSADGYRYQIIYRSMVGGNHYNHVHIGVAATSEG